MRRAILALAIFAMGCNDDITQIVIEVSSDLQVPDDLDRVGIVMVRDDDGAMMTAEALLGPGQFPLPRRLGVVWEGGSLGPFRTTVTGYGGSTERVSHVADLTFVQGEQRTWQVNLSSSCRGVTCEGETCDDGECRVVEEGMLVPFAEPEPRGDAGVVCLDEERCNARDDDCDGNVDEGIDTETDDDNCGECGNRCADVPNADATCMAGSCEIDSCDVGFDDCSSTAPGCETNINEDDNNCGGCGTRCNGNRECCDGTCADCR